MQQKRVQYCYVVKKKEMSTKYVAGKFGGKNLMPFQQNIQQNFKKLVNLYTSFAKVGVSTPNITDPKQHTDVCK